MTSFIPLQGKRFSGHDHTPMLTQVTKEKHNPTADPLIRFDLSQFNCWQLTLKAQSHEMHVIIS